MENLSHYANEFDSPLDHGIAQAVKALREAGVETYESCEGGPGHAFPEPTVRFYGELPEGFRALAAAQCAGLQVYALRRVYQILDREPVGPHWEMVFRPQSGLPFWMKQERVGATNTHARD